MIKKIIVVLCVALVACAIYTNIQRQKAQQDSGKKNVYAILPLTGNLAALGKDSKKTLELFMQQTENLPFNILFYDNKSQSTESLNIAQQIAMFDKNPLFICGPGQMCHSIIPNLKAMNGFMIFAPTTQTEDGTYHEFQRVSFNTEDMNKPFYDFIKPGQTVVIIYGNAEASALAAQIISKAIELKGARVLAKLAYEHNQLDTRILALKAIKDNPDVVLISGGPTPGFVNIIRSLKEQEYSGIILADPSLRTPALIAQVGTQADGIYVPVMPTARIYKEYPEVAKILQENGLELYNFPIVMWDVGAIMVHFFNNKIPFTQEEFMKMGQWHGISGDIQFTENGNSSYPFGLSVIKNGQFVPVEESEGK